MTASAPSGVWNIAIKERKSYSTEKLFLRVALLRCYRYLHMVHEHNDGYHHWRDSTSIPVIQLLILPRMDQRRLRDHCSYDQFCFSWQHASEPTSSYTWVCLIQCKIQVFEKLLRLILRCFAVSWPNDCLLSSIYFCKFLTLKNPCKGTSSENCTEHHRWLCAKEAPHENRALKKHVTLRWLLLCFC